MKRKNRWIALIVLLAAVVLVTVAALSGGSNDTADTADEMGSIQAATTDGQESEGLSVPKLGKTITVRLDGVKHYAEAQRALELINLERMDYGLAPLTMDRKLMRCAMQRAAECAVYTDAEHTRPNGQKYSSILKEQGVSYGVAGENIAGGYDTADEVMQAWMASDDHRANILDTDFTAIGIGCFRQANGETFWTELFTDKVRKQANRNQDREETVEVEVKRKKLGKASLVINKPELPPEQSTHARLYIANKGWSGAVFYLSPKDVTFSSHDEGIAVADDSGRITGVTEGKTTIYADYAEGGLSAKKKIDIRVSMKAMQPEISHVVNRSNGIRLKWKELPGATRYELYRSEEGAAYELLATTSARKYLDDAVTDGFKYKYKVYAYRNETRSHASGYKMIYRMPTPVINEAVASKSKIELRWSGAEDVSGCQIEYRLKGGATKIMDQKSDLTAAKVKGLISGMTYTVRVRSYKVSNGTIRYSGWSSRVKVKMQ